MKKTYPEQLGEWIKQKKSTQRNKNLVEFLAVSNDVKSAIESGFSVKTIWNNLYESKRIEFGYNTFLSYVNRTLRNVQKNKQMQPNHRPEFTFNPTPNREDLI